MMPTYLAPYNQLILGARWYRPQSSYIWGRVRLARQIVRLPHLTDEKKRYGYYVWTPRRALYPLLPPVGLVISVYLESKVELGINHKKNNGSRESCMLPSDLAG